MFKEGEIVKIPFTGEYGMVIGVHKSEGYATGYDVRLTDYRVVKFYEYELAKREKEETKEDQPCACSRGLKN